MDLVTRPDFGNRSIQSEVQTVLDELWEALNFMLRFVNDTPNKPVGEVAGFLKVMLDHLDVHGDLPGVRDADEPAACRPAVPNGHSHSRVHVTSHRF